jgi:hypothetical protein
MMLKIAGRGGLSEHENRRRMRRPEPALHTITAACRHGIESADAVIRFD